jgi:formylglycine-generating enzyme required for sulfatase activity
MIASGALVLAMSPACVVAMGDGSARDGGADNNGNGNNDGSAGSDGGGLTALDGARDATSSATDAHSAADVVAPIVDAGAHDAAAPPPGAAIDVPAGTFVFLSQENTMTTVTFTHDVYMDVDEMTAGRFRAWVAAARPTPSSTCSTGHCTLDPGGPYEATMTWDPAWDQAATSELYKNTNCLTMYSVSGGSPTYNNADDNLPITCLNWYQAVAFCFWDGGKRLPTQAEWQYEATGRGMGNTYPWGDVPAPTDCSRAIWNNAATITTLNPYNNCNFPLDVGATPLGASRDGVLDMAGSVGEWTWDWAGPDGIPYYPPLWPNDYAGPPDDAGYPNTIYKMVRGGGWDSADTDLHSTAVTNVDLQNSATTAYSDVGVRCVKSKL